VSSNPIRLKAHPNGKSSVTASPSRDLCYDFKNIFAEKISEKIGVFDSKQSQILKKK
jgi:hypothetical protein